MVRIEGFEDASLTHHNSIAVFTKLYLITHRLHCWAILAAQVRPLNERDLFSQEGRPCQFPTLHHAHGALLLYQTLDQPQQFGRVDRF